MSTLINFLITINSFNQKNYNHKKESTKNKKITEYAEKSLNKDYNKLKYHHTKIKQRYKSYKPPTETEANSLFTSTNDINKLLIEFNK